MSDRVEHDFELTIILTFEHIQSSREFGIGSEHLECGHSPHLDQPARTLEVMREFVDELK